MSASEGMSTRSFSEISEEELMVRVGVDLVAAAKRNLGFLRLIAESHWLHQKPNLIEAIRRYEELWMPLISDLMVGSTAPMVLPPLDIEWVWYCHTSNPVSYRQYCKSRFSKIIGKPAIFNEENEEYAFNRCREIWIHRYPSEPFENEVDCSSNDFVVCNEELFGDVLNQRCLYAKFSKPYMSELVYLIAAKRRYKGFLYMMQRFADDCSRLVPTEDILLMWLTHQSYPTVYATDVKEMEGIMWKVVGTWDAKENEVEETKKMWERTFDEPYEKAGCEAIGGVLKVTTSIYWGVIDVDINTKYKSLLPRFLLEVCLMVKLNPKTNTTPTVFSKDFLRFQMLRCHRELKINQPLSNLTCDSWKKVCHLYCEFGTKGLQLELRHPGGGRCFKGSSLLDTVTFSWNNLLRAPSLTFGREISQKLRVVASLTPPVQASYLLKCVPDRVTDDSGAMISDVILSMNQYRPQEGRWLSRTVLDHARRECFVVRIRVAGGFWRRGGEAPSAMKWEDRVTEIREGSWSYAAGSIGRAPAKLVGTATPKEPSEGWQASWSFSTGDELLIKWGSSASISSLCFELKSQISTDSWWRILIGRQMQFQEKISRHSKEVKDKEKEQDEDDGFVTLVRYSEEDHSGKATALLNWKLLLIELLPEEDAAFALLLCISILRSVSEMRKEDVGGLLIRRRLKEPKLGARDWGSVILHPSLSSPAISSPYVHPWYWNPKGMMALDGVDMMRPVSLKYSPEEGDDQLYKHVIIS